MIQSLYGDGGTELYAPLQTILSKGVELKKKQQIIVITDGEVSNTGEFYILIFFNIHFQMLTHRTIIQQIILFKWLVMGKTEYTIVYLVLV